MTNPDNAGGMPELPELPRRCYEWHGDELWTAGAVRRFAIAYGELCRAATAGGDDQKDYEMDKTIYDLAIHCGAHVDGGEYPDHSANFAGSPPTIEFTDRQLEKFVEKLLDGSYAYAGFQK